MKIGSIKENLVVIIPLAVFFGLSWLIYLNPPIFEGIFELNIKNTMFIVGFLIIVPGLAAGLVAKYLRQILSGDDDSKFKF